MTTATRAVGAPLARVEPRAKVTGAALYAYEHPREEIAYAWVVPASIARGTIRSIDVGSPPVCSPSSRTRTRRGSSRSRTAS